MRSLIDQIPEVDVLLALEPEELAGEILEIMKATKERTTSGIIISQIWPISFSPIASRYPDNKRQQVEIAIVEAFSWLQAQGLIIPEPGPNGQNGYMILSRRAKRIKSSSDFADYAVTRFLPRELLHQRISTSAWLTFMRGAYATGVFEAMREVEIAVREAAGYATSEHGVPMIRRAFHKENGPLTDLSSDEAEREALSALFAGAIGSYKNPHSHRHVPLDDPKEAAEIIMLASHLLRIVDSRARTGA